MGKGEGIKIISAQIEQEIYEIVQKIIKTQNNPITSQDAKSIVDAILPEIDKLISKKIKKHFRLLAEHVLKNLKE
jgi:nucleoid DNA-binding protein